MRNVQNGSDGGTDRAAVLTARDLAILDTLTRRVKVLSVRQVAQWFWGGEWRRRSAIRRLRELARLGLVNQINLPVVPEVELIAPLATWKAGNRTPNWTDVLRRSRSRWSAPAVSESCIVAATAAAARFGTTPRPPRLSEATHDLHVAQVYLRLRQGAPRLAKVWEGEALRQCDSVPGDKIPDALIRRAGRRVAIEIVGASYGAKKLGAFHAYCENQNLTYELW